MLRLCVVWCWCVYHRNCMNRHFICRRDVFTANGLGLQWDRAEALAATVDENKWKKEDVRRCVSQDHMRYWLSRDHEVVEESQFAVQIPPLKLRMFNIVRLVTLQKNLSPSVFFSDRLKTSLSFRRCALRYIKTNWKNENQSTKRMTHKHIFTWNHLWTKGNKLTTSNLFAYRCSRTTANPFFNSPHRRLCNNDRNQIFELVNTNGRVEIGLWSEHVCVSNWINTELYEGHNKKRCWMLVG